MTKSRNINAPAPRWTDAQVKQLRALYPDYPTGNLAVMLGCSIARIYQKAQGLGLKKSAQFLASPEACRLRRGGNVGVGNRFQPGQAPWNQGQAFAAGGRSIDTQFKAGSRPHTWRPIGTERVADGYLQRKMTDTGYPPRDWVGVHLLVWQEHNGPIPAKHVVTFKDGDKTNVAIENLECLSRGAMMKRNSVHNLPKELVELVQLRGVLTRQINQRITP